MIKAIAHRKAEPIKACVRATSNPGNDVGNEVSVDPVDVVSSTLIFKPGETCRAYIRGD